MCLNYISPLINLLSVFFKIYITKSDMFNKVKTQDKPFFMKIYPPLVSSIRKVTLDEVEGGGVERLICRPWTLLTSIFLCTLASPLASTPSNFRNPCNLFEIFPDELQWLNQKNVCQWHQDEGLARFGQDLFEEWYHCPKASL